MDRNAKRLVRIGAGVTAALGATAIAWAATNANAESSDPVDTSDEAQINIINGQPVEEGQYPWLVGLGFAGEGTPYDNQFCGGSAITEDVILTAAHCVEVVEQPSDMVVFSGSVDLESEDVVTTEVVDIHAAEDYADPTTFSNDWALVRLAEPIDVEPIGLDYDAADFESFEVAGWGLDENDEFPTVARWVEVPFVDDAPCGESYGTDFDADTMVCAGDLENGEIDSCSGDSGGPLMGTDENGEQVVAGIVSWGNDCALAGYPGVYAEVAAFTDTIDEVLAGWEAPETE